MAERGALAPDLVLTGGRVLTMDARNSEAQAVAIRDGRIVAVGADDDVLRLGRRRYGGDRPGRPERCRASPTATSTWQATPAAR